MRRFVSGHIPPVERILLIESGSRGLIEKLVPALYSIFGESTEVDVLTCYEGVPRGLSAGSRVFCTVDYGPQERERLLGELVARNYSIAGVLCSAEPVMTKWKWWLAWRLPVKLFIINENADFFWADRKHWRMVLHFALFRGGLTGVGAAQTIARLLLFPFTLAYLAAYAGWVHLRRRIRLARG